MKRKHNCVDEFNTNLTAEIDALEFEIKEMQVQVDEHVQVKIARRKTMSFMPPLRATTVIDSPLPQQELAGPSAPPGFKECSFGIGAAFKLQCRAASEL